MTVAHDREPTAPLHQLLGTNTYRHGFTGGSTMLRDTLYSKNLGTSTMDRGLIRTDSPISGSLLLSHASTCQAVKDPISGTKLQLQGGKVAITAPVQKQQLIHSKKFYLTSDVDITLQMLRSTTKVSRYTNEKIGTAGTATGMDNSLKAFKDAQRQQKLREQQQAQQADSSPATSQ